MPARQPELRNRREWRRPRRRPALVCSDHCLNGPHCSLQQRILFNDMTVHQSSVCDEVKKSTMEGECRGTLHDIVGQPAAAANRSRAASAK